MKLGKRSIKSKKKLMKNKVYSMINLYKGFYKTTEYYPKLNKQKIMQI